MWPADVGDDERTASSEVAGERTGRLLASGEALRITRRGWEGSGSLTLSWSWLQVVENGLGCSILFNQAAQGSWWQGKVGEIVGGCGGMGARSWVVLGAVKVKGGVRSAWRSWVAVCAGKGLCGWLRLGWVAPGCGTSSWAELGDRVVCGEQRSWRWVALGALELGPKVLSRPARWTLT